jgi:LysR family hydrogen peroxide-inducible transcriptional activator
MALPVMGGPASVSLRQLQYIVAVAERGGFSRAADFCHVSQPSLSAQVALAEAQLGVQIFERSRHGVRVSAAGLALVEHARRVIGAQHELEAVASHLRDPFRGTMRVGVLPTVGPYLLPDIAPAVDRAYPHLTLLWREERTATLVRDLHEGHLEAAILALESDLSGLEHTELRRDAFVLAASPRHRLGRSTRPVSLTVLHDETVLLLDDGHCFREQVWNLCARVGASETSFRATSLSTLMQMVASGAGVTLLPELAVPVENRTGQLVVRPFTRPGPGRTLVLAWRTGSALAEAITTVGATIRDAVGTTATGGPERARTRQSVAGTARR